jgi:hypothetical protein
MPVKQLKWWEGEFLRACGLACLYGVELSVDQFCASRGLEPEDRDLLLPYLRKHCIAE